MLCIRAMGTPYEDILKRSRNRPQDEGPLFSVPERLQARLNVEQTAKVLGFSVHDIPILCHYGFLKPLGNPAPNAPKYFSSSSLKKVAENEGWLNKATETIYEYWRGKNGRKNPKNPVIPEIELERAVSA
jgi:hypothetical protein